MVYVASHVRVRVPSRRSVLSHVHLTEMIRWSSTKRPLDKEQEVAAQADADDT